MFDSKQKNESHREPAFTANSSSRPVAAIGASIAIKGDIAGDEDLIIAGRVEGNINLTSHEVTVSQGGSVSADVTANTIKIEGLVNGDLAGNEKVVITKTGKVQGNIVAPRVTLEGGAKFKGSIDMDPGSSTTIGLAAVKTADDDKADSVAG